MADKPSIGGDIRNQRSNRNWTLKDLAARVDLSISYLSDIENGRTDPSFQTAVRIAAAFDMTLAELYGGAELSLSADEHRLLEAWRCGDVARLLTMIAKQLNEE